MQNGRTAISYASERGSLDVVCYLYDKLTDAYSIRDKDLFPVDAVGEN